MPYTGINPRNQPNQDGMAGRAVATTRLLSHTVTNESRPLSTSSRGGLELTEREREVLTRVAHGERSKEIAARLGITERTVKAHLARRGEPWPPIPIDFPQRIVQNHSFG